MNHLKIVILAGGVGKRLWPMSTKEKPKQFQKLVSEKTMLQETFERVSFVPAENIYVSTNAEYLHFIREQLPNLPEDHIIAEPSHQDTGPCIGLAAAMIAKEDPEAVMAVIYADHLIRNEEEFKNKLQAAAKLAAEENTLNIIEVIAKSPNTNLGYVKIGELLKEENGVKIHEFLEFKEKPDLQTAEQFISSKDYLWNTGYYVWRVSRILQEFQKHLPETYKELLAIQNGAAIEAHYPKCEKISIDYGIMEKADPVDVRIIPADLGWSDIGTWASLHEELAEKPTDNIIKGGVIQVDSEGNLIYNESDQNIAVLGLKDTIVICTGKETLICPKDRSADLKTLLDEFKNT